MFAFDPRCVDQPWRLLAGASFVLMLLGACSERPPSIPNTPPALEVTDEYAFSTAIGCLDGQTWGEVWDRALAEFGRQGLRIERYVMPKAEPWDDLKAYYAGHLVKSQGWREDDAIVFKANVSMWSDFAWSFAFRRDGYVVALVGLQPKHGEGGYVPVNVITNVPKP